MFLLFESNFGNCIIRMTKKIIRILFIYTQIKITWINFSHKSNVCMKSEHFFYFLQILERLL